ncbi:MAG: hypothetical protein NC489_15115 [Ruminococcus flavefaciens]|nr:hypothetical protein [Roseburia sp.]MCM1231448.1 hypothetical protein [Ruminococcus flavefaciens]
MTAYNEEEFILNKFKQNFFLYKDKKIVLYGTGKNTKAIIREYEQDFGIAGIMDIGKEGQTFYGKKVLSKELVKNMHIDLIILVCLPVSEDIVYERIREFAEKEQISVYNLDGMRLYSHVKEYQFVRMSDTEKKRIAETEGLYALLKNTKYYDFEYKADTWIKHKMLDFFIGELLKHPVDVKEEGKVFIADLEKLGYLYWGPIFTGYLLWMVKEAMSDQCDIILFQSRDGYLLQKMFRVLKRTYKEVSFPADIYFLASRRASIVAGIRTEEDIKIAARYSWYGSDKDFMERRFGVKVDGKELSEMEHEQYAIKYKDKIFKRAGEEQLNYRKYLNSLNLSQYQKAALIDTTAVGTVQTNLQHFMELPMKGYYFLKRVSEVVENNQIEFSSYYPVNSQYKIRENVFAYFRLMELILSSREASLICFNVNGEPEYAKEKRGEEEKDIIQSMQKGVLRYFDDICNMHLKWQELMIDREFADVILGTMNRQNIIIGDDRIKSLTMEDYYRNIEEQVCERL